MKIVVYVFLIILVFISLFFLWVKPFGQLSFFLNHVFLWALLRQRSKPKGILPYKPHEIPKYVRAIK